MPYSSGGTRSLVAAGMAQFDCGIVSISQTLRRLGPTLNPPHSAYRTTSPNTTGTHRTSHLPAIRRDPRRHWQSGQVVTGNHYPLIFSLRLTAPFVRFGIFAAVESSKLSSTIMPLPGCSLTVGRSLLLPERMRLRYVCSASVVLQYPL